MLESKSHRRHQPKRYKSTEKTIKIQDLVPEKSSPVWKKVIFRDGDKGELIVEVIQCRVWFWGGKTGKAW